MTREQRREQLLRVTLLLIERYGIQGATVARVVSAAGVTQPTLYRYFGSRRELLITVFWLVTQRLLDQIEAARKPDALEWLREVGRSHAAQLQCGGRKAADPLVEFISAPVRLRLRDTVIQGHRRVIQRYVEIIDEGKSQGCIRFEVDSLQTAWHISGLLLLDDVAHLVGEDRYLHPLSLGGLEAALATIATVPRH